MRFWNYIGEILLFRWLFGSHSHNATENNNTDSPIRARYDNQDNIYSQSDFDIDEELDDFDMFDDDF